MTKLNRRDFLKGLGIIGGAAAITPAVTLKNLWGQGVLEPKPKEEAIVPPSKYGTLSLFGETHPLKTLGMTVEALSAGLYSPYRKRTTLSLVVEGIVPQRAFPFSTRDIPVIHPVEEYAIGAEYRISPEQTSWITMHGLGAVVIKNIDYLKHETEIEITSVTDISITLQA